MGRRTQKKPKSQRGQQPTDEAAESKIVDQVAEILRREVDSRLGPDATYEQRRDAEAELMRKILWKREDDDLRESASSAGEVEIAGKRYRRLEQPSSAIYHRRWGSTRSRSRCTGRSASTTGRRSNRWRCASGSSRAA